MRHTLHIRFSYVEWQRAAYVLHTLHTFHTLQQFSEKGLK